MIKRIFVISLNTFRESVRSKILYSIVIFALAVTAASSAFGSVTIGNQVKVLKDFGLFAITLFSVAFSVISGSSFLHKELSRKTIYNILSKGVHRSEFVLGKFIGMLLTLLLMVAGMGAGLMSFMYFYEGVIDWLILYALAGIMFQLTIVAALVIFFSAIVVTPMLSGVFSFGLFLAGRSCEYLIELIRHQIRSEVFKPLIQIVYNTLPHLDKLDISNTIVYGVFPDAGYLVSSIWYSLSYAAVLLLMASLFFGRREFN